MSYPNKLHAGDLDIMTGPDEYRRLNFSLHLSADEFDWLLDILNDTARRHRVARQASNALDVEGAIKTWTADVVAQGYKAALAGEEKPCDCGCQGTWGRGLTCMEEHTALAGKE